MPNFNEKLVVTLELDSSKSEQQLRKQVSEYKRAAKNIDGYTKDINRELSGTDRAATKLSGSTQKLRGAFGQLGFQVQDIAVQLQNGTNALVVFGQQGSQIAGIFGPAGAIVGGFIAVGAALGTAFLPALFDSTTASDRLKEALSGLDGVLTSTKLGTRQLTDEVLALARASKVSAELEITKGLVLASKAFNESRSAFRETLDDSFGSLTIGFEQAIAQATRLKETGYEIQEALDLGSRPGISDSFLPGGNAINLVRDELEKLRNDFGLTQEQGVALFDAIAQAEIDPSTSNLNQLEKTIARIGVEARNTSPAFVEIAAQLADQVRTAKDAKSAQEQLEKALKDIDSALQRASKSSDDYVNGLRGIRNASVENTELGFIGAIERGQKAINEQWEEQVRNQERANTAYEEGIKAIRNANVENTELGFIDAQIRGQAVLNEQLAEKVKLQEKLAKEQQREAEIRQEQLLTEFEALEKDQKDYKFKDDPIGAELDRYKANKELIAAAAEANLDLQQRANLAMEAEEKRHKETMRQLQINQFQPLLQGAQMVFGNLSTLMNSENKKMFEIGKKAAIANALISGAEAVVHSYNFGAQIGGPPLGAVFATAAAAATMTQIQAIKSQQFGGGSGSISAGANSAAYEPTVPQQPLGPVSGSGRGGQIVFDFSGANLNGDPDVLAEQLAGAILEPLRDRIDTTDFVLISNGSRNAQEIRGDQ